MRIILTFEAKMSDGPHKSLPMRPAWRRVAERADKHAFTLEEVSAAMAPALEQDCRDDISPEFIRQIQSALDRRESSLFKKEIALHVNDLRSEVACSMERAVLDNVCAVSDADATAADILLNALASAVSDRAARGARQVEEHYLRGSSAPRARKVRERLEAAIATTDRSAIAARILARDQLQPPHPLKKRSGIDDGVKLP
jgi:hypothetical protein